MPWVIANYESEQLDLSKPENYRDLSKPMGALNPARLKEFLDRFYSFEDNVTTGIPAFMYGSHYSTMVGVVLHFLVRLQPFAALHKEMQNGHFDVPDRLFSSIPRSFKHNTTQLSEVKELTPEWFTTPEIFKNVNNFEFGKTQDGDLVSDVELPPWANSAEEFVRIHRAALESDYVTEHLHEWIDLIFGFKQRGPDSIDACNVFYYLTYYGSVNQYMIKDDGLRKATELQIAHFGQVPMQLFTTPHPPNMSRRNRMQSATVQVPRPLIQAVDQEVSNRTKVVCDEENVSLNAPSTLIRKSSSPFHSTSAVARQKQVTVLSVIVLKERLLCVMSNGVIDMMKYGVTESAKSAIAIAAASRKVDHKRKSTVATKQSSDLMSDSNEKQHENIISFDDEAPIALEAGNTMDDLIDIERKADGSLPVSALLAPDEPLIYVEKEFFHFEEIPRLPLFQIHEDSVGSQADPPILDGKAKANSLRAERVSGLLVFTQSKRLALSAGAIDGRIAVRELDLGIGGVKSAGDFRAHRRRVISICTDNIPSGNTDVVCSCDESGQILVWTISTLKGLHSSGKAQGSAAIKDPFSCIISRRPQRSFRCIPSDQMKCEVSWQLGVVVGVSGNSVSIFSIERDELIRSFITNPDPRDSIREKNAANVTDCSFTGPGLLSREGASMSSNLVADMRNEVKSNLFQANYATRLVVLSDVGALVLYVECCRLVDSLINGDDQTERTHWLLSYTLAGIRTAIKEQHNALTHLSCPARGEVIVTGHNDGSVLFHRYLDLVPLYSFYPHLHSVRMELKLVPSISKPSTRSSVNSQFNAKEETRFEKFNEEIHPSPVIAVAVGPNAAFPALICVTTAAGDVFLKALPDFVKWERFRSPSALAQLANVPLQAVRGTIQQAQNIHVWTTETAGVIAQNARNFADDALEELKKVP